MANRLTDKELAERVRASARERATRRREKQEALGNVQTVVWLPSELRKQIETMTEGRTLSETVTALLEAGLKFTSTPATAYGVEPESMPTSREALATIGHGWREEGESLEGIAERFNKNGWTPDRIPKEPGTKPRADASKAWSSKTVSQLLNRDYPPSQK